MQRRFTGICLTTLITLTLLWCLPAGAAKKHAQPKSPVITVDWSYSKQVGYDKVEARAVMPKSRQFTLVDSRPYEGRYLHGYIPTAVSLPDSAFDKKAAEVLPKNMDAELIFYCQGVDCTLSHQSAFKAEKLGYTNVSVYTGGLPDWLAHGGAMAVGVQHVKQKLEKNEAVILVDSRPANKFADGSIPTAISIPDSQFDQRKGMLPADKNMQVFFFCGGFDCTLSHQSAAKAKRLGYKNVGIVEAGYPAWVALYGSGVAVAKKDGKADAGVYPVAEFEKALASGNLHFVIVDTRVEAEFRASHIPGSINITNDTLESRINSLPRNKDIIFICTTGSRAGEAYYMAMDMNPDAKNFHYLEASIKFTEDGGYQITPN